jgi:hypothetical protein
MTCLEVAVWRWLFGCGCLEAAVGGGRLWSPKGGGYLEASVWRRSFGGGHLEGGRLEVAVWRGPFGGGRWGLDIPDSVISVVCSITLSITVLGYNIQKSKHNDSL